MNYIIDRIEGEYAVCETDDIEFINIPLSDLPTDVEEGDCLFYDGSSYQIDKDKTAKKRAAIKRKMDRLFVD